MTRIVQALLIAAMAAAPLPLAAQTAFPERAVRLVVPFPPGGTIDAVARALGQNLHEKWKQPVIVENRPGAGNTVGATAVAQAAPDGHTLLFANTSVSVNPSLFATLPYDTLRDLVPVTYLSPSPNILLAQQSLRVKSLMELLALAKTRSDKPLTYASVGKGSAHHFCMELLASEAGVKLLHVPYRGVAPAVLAVTRGEVDLYCSDIPGALSLLQGDKVVALGITSKTRSPALPNVPAFAEAGLPNYAQTGYVGIMTTGKTPAAVVQKLNADINEVIKEPAFAKRFATFGYEMVGGTVDGFAAFLKDDIERYRALTRKAGIKPE